MVKKIPEHLMITFPIYLMICNIWEERQQVKFSHPSYRISVHPGIPQLRLLFQLQHVALTSGGASLDIPKESAHRLFKHVQKVSPRITSSLFDSGKKNIWEVPSFISDPKISHGLPTQGVHGLARFDSSAQDALEAPRMSRWYPVPLNKVK